MFPGHAGRDDPRGRRGAAVRARHDHPGRLGASHPQPARPLGGAGNLQADFDRPLPRHSHAGRPRSAPALWDQVLDADADLARIPHERARPERFVLDEQISAGYMHSGYPIMAHLDVERAIVTAEKIAKGEDTWGYFHEIGHNHQSGDWTFEGTGEVTVNLFTMYVHDTICHRRDLGRPDLTDPEKFDAKIRSYFQRGAHFEEWKQDPFLALCMYIQLQHAFGWKAYQDVFAEYRSLPSDQRPHSDDEKRDQWLVRFSRAVHQNLGPFFQAWGVPTSTAARQSVADLPDWMPAHFPPSS